MKQGVIAFVSVLLSMSLFCGCDSEKISSGDSFGGSKTENNNIGGEPNVSGVKASEFAVPTGIVTGDFDKHFESCKSKEYVNLDWTSAQKTQPPGFTECYNIEVNKQFESLSNKEAITQIQNYCKLYFKDNYNSDNIFFTSDRDFPYAILEGNGMTFGNAGARLNEYKSVVENDDSVNIIGFFYVDLERNSYLWKPYVRGPIWLTRGLAIELTGNIFRPTGLLPSDLLNEYPYEVFLNDGSLGEETYKLSDGEYSIRDAVNYFTDDYFPSQPFDNIGDFSCEVKSVYAIEAAEDMFFYLLKFTPTWNSIPFDTRGEFIAYNSKGRYFAFDSQALIVKKNDVDMAYDFSPPEIKNIGAPIDKMLTLEKAADIASESLSKAVVFEVRFAELIYSGIENTESGISYLSPAWKFTMFNSNDGRFYNVYINAVSGECSYYSYSPL